jgi:hypothetical protein
MIGLAVVHDPVFRLHHRSIEIAGSQRSGGGSAISSPKDSSALGLAGSRAGLVATTTTAEVGFASDPISPGGVPVELGGGGATVGKPVVTEPVADALDGGSVVSVAGGKPTIPLVRMPIGLKPGAASSFRMRAPL